MLLAVTTALVLQIRKQRRRLLELQRESEEDISTDLSSRPDAELEMSNNGNGPGELDTTFYEVMHPQAPQHEVAGHEFLEIGPQTPR